ncbi:hypothetical protein L6452_39309 [Arctium lappa]|uniref:Uncharacterized protein n=1 Tax=Arctium lappa TaxID=4217 RepID=A0ACB8XT46_ARCLA|nr:hypothetical protein L6452_39309 [Arctium lappa]
MRDVAFQKGEMVARDSDYEARGDGGMLQKRAHRWVRLPRSRSRRRLISASMNCIIDKNARIGKDVVIANRDGVEEADRSDEGFYIRSGITVILKNATIKDGTIV